MELVAKLEEPRGEAPRAICVVDDCLYVVDGNALYKMQVKRETYWEYIAKKLGISRLFIMEKLGIALVFLGGGLVGAGLVVNGWLLPNPFFMVYDLFIGAVSIIFGYIATRHGLEEKFRDKHFPNRII